MQTLERNLTLPEIDSLLELFRAGGGEQAEVSDYDLDTPSRVPKSSLEAVTLRHEQAARILRNDLSALLNRDLTVSLDGLEQMRFGNVRDSLSEPMCGYVIELSPLREAGFLVIDHAFAYATIDRLLGGSGEPTGEPRELSATEIAVLDDVVRLILAAHVFAWQPYTTLKAQVTRPVAVARYVRDIRVEDIMLLARYRLGQFADGATIQFAIPLGGLEPHLQHEPRPVVSPPNRANLERDLLKNVAGAHVEVAVRLGTANLSLRDLVGLQKDDVIVLDRQINEGCELLVEGKPKYVGFLGQHNGSFTYRVARPAAVKPAPKPEPTPPSKKT